MQFDLPIDYSAVTVKQYVQYMTAATDIERVMAATGLSRKLAGGINIDSIGKILQAFNDVLESGRGIFQRTVKLRGKDYGFIPSLDDIAFDEYVDATGLSKLVYTDHRWSELPKLLAIFYRPITDRLADRYAIEPYDSETMKARASVMEEMTMDTATGVTLFFSVILTEYVNDSRRSSQEAMKMLATEMRKTLNLIDEEMMSHSQADGDGTTSSNVWQVMT
jgi:hypothetical protein